MTGRETMEEEEKVESGTQMEEEEVDDVTKLIPPEKAEMWAMEGVFTVGSGSSERWSASCS